MSKSEKRCCLKMPVKAVIFDLDGVIVSTDEHHYRAWKRLADEEAIYFDRQVNQRLRGVSRMQSLEILLESACKQYTQEEKTDLASRKNTYYRESIDRLSPDDVLTGAVELIAKLKQRGIKVAVASSSRNAPLILARIGLARLFDAIVDGNDITKSKPDPQVFLLAAARLGVEPARCMVVEDATAGVEAAFAAGMAAVGVGGAAEFDGVAFGAESVSDIKVECFTSHNM